MITRGRLAATVLASVLLLVIVGAVVLTPRTSAQPLDPASARGDGTRAVARVLAQHGVRVTVVRGVDGLAAGTVSGATVVLTRSELLSGPSLARMMSLVGHARRLVLVEPDATALRVLGLPVGVAPLAGVPNLSCGVRWLQGLRVSFADVTYTVAASGRTCFGASGSPGAGAIATLPARGRAPEIVLLGSRAVLANGTVSRADNAAIALRTLGVAQRLVWLAPTPATADNPATQGPSWPAWFHPAIWLAAIVVLVVMVWRGRRFGRLAIEPLAVVVSGDETTRSRGQLYRRARDVSRVAAVLRLATRNRLARYLGLAPGGPPETLIRRTAQAAQTDPERTAALLYGPQPADEASMTALAQDLQQLERQVRR